ncbi:MAG: bile acid:sodium symporter family protein [Candidatus Omnitrophica bacterium]|nr:bile acid:sodium symporter family protein [Candidatus Omnitrophota bacterium]
MINKIAERFTKLLAVWVLVAVGIGYYFPSFLLKLKPYTELLFSLTMFGIGAVLNAREFIPILKAPQKVVLGTLAQFLIMPLTGFLLARMLRLAPELALGLILTGAVPGAMASNVLSYLAKADVAYSITLTSVSTFLSPVLTPFFTYIFGRTIIEIHFWQMFMSIINIVIIPLLLGMFLRHFARQGIERLKSIFPAFSSLFIAFICGLVVALNKGYLSQITYLIFLAIILHNLIGLVGGYAAAVVYRFDEKRRRTLSLEVGMQNAGLGAVLALKHFSSQAALPPALFATWCIITASLLAGIWSRNEKIKNVSR